MQGITMTLAGIRDLFALEELNKECDRYFEFDPQCEPNHNCSLEECLTLGDIPPNIGKDDFKRENYYFYCIWKDDALIGFLAYYLEYQQKDTAYLSVLYVKEADRGNGVGGMILDMLMQKIATAHFKEVRLHCSLRNSLALRFWVKNGFDRIVDVECNGNLFPENFAGIELTKTLAFD